MAFVFTTVKSLKSDAFFIFIFYGIFGTASYVRLL